METCKYAAFLRGINLGNKNKVGMAELKQTLESLSFRNVKTLLNSGNVVFETTETDVNRVRLLIEKKLLEVFGFSIDVLIRPFDEIQLLVDSDPFKGVHIIPETRLYVTFLSEPSRRELNSNELSSEGFKIMKVSDTEVCTLVTDVTKFGTTDAMKILEKVFGKNITTRNWNTVQKVASL